MDTFEVEIQGTWVNVPIIDRSVLGATARGDCYKVIVDPVHGPATRYDNPLRWNGKLCRDSLADGSGRRIVVTIFV